MARRFSYLLVLGAIFVLLLAGCAAPAAAPVADGGDGEAAGVTMSLWTRDSNQAQVRTLVDAWNDSHDNQIEVTVIPAGEFVTKVGTAVAGGAAPDIIAIDLIYVPAFAAAGQMTDITDLAKGLPYFDELSHSHVRLATYEDKIHALPFNAEGSVLFYNKDLFEQAGLDPESPPTTWAEIAEASEAISALGDDIYGYYFSGACAGCNAFTFLPLIWASGGDVLNEDGTAATMDDPMVAAALEFYKGLWDAGQVPAGAQVDSGSEFANTFPGGNIGMQGLGAFAINMLKTDFPEVNFGVAPLPGMDGGNSSFAGGDSIGIPAGSEYVDEAFEFLAWLTSEDVQLEHYAQVNSLPVRADLADNEYFAEDPRLTTNANAMATGRTPYTTVYNQLFNDANGPWLEMFQTAIFDGDVEGAIATAQEKFTDILAEAE